MKPLLFTLPAVLAAGGGILAFASRRRQAVPRTPLVMAATSLVKAEANHSSGSPYASEASHLSHATIHWMSTAVSALSLLLVLIVTAAMTQMAGSGTSALSLLAVVVIAAATFKLSPVASARTPLPSNSPKPLTAPPSDNSPSGSKRPAASRPSPLLQGTWIRDANRSESMVPVMDTMQLGGLVRMAVKLVRGCEIKLLCKPSPSSSGGQEEGQGSHGEFQLDVFSAIKWFKVREKYPLDGKIGRFKRRDLRGGRHEGRVEVLEDGALRLHLRWDEPHGGMGTDTFRLISQDELHVTSELRKSGSETKVSYNTVYRRKR